MTRDRIRVGIVGANLSAADPLRHSWGARAHLPALTALPEFEVVADVFTRAISDLREEIYQD